MNMKDKQQTAVKPFDLQKFLAGEPITTLGGHEVVAFRYDTNFEGLHPLKVAIKETTGLISHYQYSIDGDPLGTINSNYILCMKDTELSMTNNKQQTAMKLYTEEQLLNTIEAIKDYLKNYPEKFHESMIKKHLMNLEPVTKKRTLIIYNTKETTEEEATHQVIEVPLTYGGGEQ